MALRVRRVVTGHDPTGRAIVKIDEVSSNVFTGRPGATACNVWTTEGFPVNNDSQADEGLRKAGTTLKSGTIFRIIEFAPGLAARNHWTGRTRFAHLDSLHHRDRVGPAHAGSARAGMRTRNGGRRVARLDDPARQRNRAIAKADAKSVEAGGKVLPAVG